MNTDTELIEMHLSGDEKASRALIEKYQNLVYGLVWRMLKDADDVQDTAQEIFLNMLGALPRFRGECAFSTWLYRIAINSCIARSKKRKQQLDREISSQVYEGQMDVPADRPSALFCLEQKERDEHLHLAVGELAEPYRAVIVLHYFEALGYEEVAQILGVPLGTVKVRLFRAKALLQRKLRV